MLAVPGEITSALSARDERAAPARRDAGHVRRRRARGARPRPGAAACRGRSSATAAARARADRGRRRDGATSSCARPALAAAAVAAALVELELRGVVDGGRRRVPGGDASDIGSTLVTTTSYWLDEPASRCRAAASRAARRWPSIGGGVTGCSCALTLAERGVRVRLHEAREIAGGASGRNGGFALRGATAPYDAARARLGHERARRAHGADRARARPARGARRRRVPARRQPAARRRRGRAATRSAREHDALREDGFAVEWVDVLDAPLDGLYRGAILHPRDGALHPARWVRRLARARRRGGRRDPRARRRSTRRRRVDADAVVVAADGYTASLLPELARVVAATRGQVLATEPLAERRYERPALRARRATTTGSSCPTAGS